MIYHFKSRNGVRYSTLVQFVFDPGKFTPLSPCTSSQKLYTSTVTTMPFITQFLTSCMVRIGISCGHLPLISWTTQEYVSNSPQIPPTTHLSLITWALISLPSFNDLQTCNSRPSTLLVKTFQNYPAQQTLHKQFIISYTVYHNVLAS